MDLTTFTGTTAQEAISQGYIYFQYVQAAAYDATRVFIDRNGHAADTSYTDFAVVDLTGVLIGQLDGVGPDANFIV
jgi:hypothetical protein